MESDLLAIRFNPSRSNPTQFPYFFDLLEQDELNQDIFETWKYYCGGKN